MRTVGSWAMGVGAGLVLVLAAVPPAQAIINGTLDSTHTAVGYVTDGATAAGSAVLIDPWWVLTSATFATAVSDGWFAVGLDSAAPDATYPFAAIFPHPSYDPGTGAHNLALIRLQTPVAGVVPIPPQTTSAPQWGDSVLYVGYGVTSLYDYDNTLRHSCVNQVDWLDAATFGTSFDGSGPYLGDNGGPALLSTGGTLRVVGVIAAGSLDGTGATMAVRVSSYATFIAAVMAANPPAAAPLPAVPVRLLGAAPNPFNPRTRIAFELDAPAACRLAVFDLRGREVAVLAEAAFVAGRHTVAWDGRAAGGGGVASGTYLVQLRAGGAVRTTKVVLAR